LESRFFIVVLSGEAGEQQIKRPHKIIDVIEILKQTIFLFPI